MAEGEPPGKRQYTPVDDIGRGFDQGGRLTIHLLAASSNVHMKGAARVNRESVVETRGKWAASGLPAKPDNRYAYSLKIVSSH